MRWPVPFRRLRRDRRGATVVEFGMIALPLAVVLAGTLDLGYTTYVKALLQGALQQAARDAAIGNLSPDQITANVKARLGALVAPQYVSTAIHSYYDFSRVGQPEKLIDDKNHNGQYDQGDCYEDANDNGHYDYAATVGRNTGGNPDEVVAYTVTASFPRLLPMVAMLGWPSTNTVTGTTMLRNQPFGKDVPPKTLCN